MTYQSIHNTVMMYLDSHIVNFEPDGKERNFINNKLKLNDKNKIEVSGFLIVPILLLIYGILINLRAILYVYELADTYGILYSILFILIHSGLLYLISKKKKITILLFKLYYLLVVIMSAFSLPSIIISSLWALYFTVSKRVKYTFVE